MSRRKKDPLRPLTEPERQELAQLSRSQSAPAVEVTRAKILLAVARGEDYQAAAHAEATTRIMAEVRRAPTPEGDGTATWSLATLRRSLRTAPDGLPRVSTYTLWRVLHEAGASYQRTRSWCPTGTALRRRKAGTAVVTDPDATPKKS